MRTKQAKQNLGEYIKKCKSSQIKTSIITNASGLTRSWLKEHGPNIDQIGISIDSLDDSLNRDLGRGDGKHIEVTQRAYDRINEANERPDVDIAVKLNTVILSYNYQETNWPDFIRKNQITRWKIFKFLPIIGENDKQARLFEPTDEDFRSFVRNHSHLEQEGVVMAPEDNEEMTESYLMITPDGRFYQNTDGKYFYSDPILQVGVEAALQQINFHYDKFVKRGGEYELLTEQAN